ncbi:MAG: hypothetical protein RLN77_09085 [Rhodospirillales bacterium]
MFIKYGAIAGCFGVLAGCTTSVHSVQLSKWNSVDGRKDAKKYEGVIYHLPMTALEVKASYRLKSCPEPVMRKKFNNLDKSQNLTVSELVQLVEGTVSAQAMADHGADATFVIDTEKLTNWFKTVDKAELVLENGMLKSVTYDAEDKTGETLVKTAGLIMSFAVSPGLPATLPLGAIAMSAGGTPEDVLFDCNAQSKAALKEEAALKSAVKKLKAEIEKQEGAVNDPNAAKDAVAKAKAALKKAQEQLAGATEKLAVLVTKVLTYSHMRDLSPVPNGEAGEVLNPQENERYAARIDVRDQLVAKFFVGEQAKNFLATQPVGLRVSVRTQALPEGEPLGAYDGIYYRTPQPARLVLQRFAETNHMALEAIADARAEMAQFGRLARIPLTNGVFQDNKYAVKFDQKGYLTSFEYYEDKARALEAATTASSIKTNLENEETRQLELEEKRIKAETNLLKAQKDRLKALEELSK